MNADKLAEQIVKEVGGKNNIKECSTVSPVCVST